MLKDFLSSFLNSALRWMGAILGVMLALAIVSGVSEEPSVVPARVISRPSSGFEVKNWKGQDAILMLRIHGEIGTGSLTRLKVRQLLEASQQGAIKGKIKALFLEIDSPGGAVDDSEGIHQMICQYSNLYQVPVYALSDGYCASGGYLIACAAKKIYATPYSTIGSVGTLARWFNVHQTLEKLGVQAFTLTCGETKGALNAFAPPRPEDEAMLKPILNQGYQRFLDAVSASRPLLTEKTLRNQIGARAYSALDAKALGFVDEIVADRTQVVTSLAKEAGLGSDFALVEIQTGSGWSDFLETQASLKSVLGKVQSVLSPTL